LVFFVTLAIPAFAPAQSGEQPKQEQAKKKPRRVWTNDDFDSGSRPAEEKKEAAAGQERSAEELFAELDAARADLAQQEKELALDRKQYEGQLERLRNADNDYDRDAYRRSLDVAEGHLTQREQTVEDLKKRITELEQLTSGLKRPAAQAKPQGPPGTAVKPGAAEVVNPGGGPIPQKEPPPPPPQ
jgi:hypothetical protein